MRSKSSSNNCPTTRRLRPSLEWSLTIIVPIFPCSAKSIISINAGLVNDTPENPSSIKKRALRKPFSFAYFSSMDCWFLILPESPSCSSSRLKRQYKAVILSGWLLIILLSTARYDMNCRCHYHTISGRILQRFKALIQMPFIVLGECARLFPECSQKRRR